MTPSKMNKGGQAILSPQGALSSLHGLNNLNQNKTPKEQYKRMAGQS